MKINYQNFNGEQKFYVQTHGENYWKDPDKFSEDLFEKFNKKEHKNKMETYLELVKKEKEIVKQRKLLLSEIKNDFQNFVQEKYPEYFV